MYLDNGEAEVENFNKVKATIMNILIVRKDKKVCDVKGVALSD